MPELPEVQTVVNHIKDELIGETIVDLKAIWPKVFHNFESVDFFKNDSPESIATKIATYNLSDISAMGSSPYAYTLSLSLPSKINKEWIKSIAQINTNKVLETSGIARHSKKNLHFWAHNDSGNNEISWYIIFNLFSLQNCIFISLR